MKLEKKNPIRYGYLNQRIKVYSLGSFTLEEANSYFAQKYPDLFSIEYDCDTTANSRIHA